MGLDLRRIKMDDDVTGLELDRRHKLSSSDGLLLHHFHQNDCSQRGGATAEFSILHANECALH